ncbi:ABC transporter permease [Desulfurivibrio sp. C05AmB]|jgi:putative ABC transport system permease protein|uniref:ABC transporter permease n=1 Tax=Desulfurivibrio sp. C05AmB TaxID=3374371 RepID=UPI00376EE2E3
MKALHRKLFRELWQLRGQSLAIAVVIAGGLATLLMSLSSLDSLRQTRDGFYREYRFGEIFAELKRAPNELAAAIAAIDGVRLAETRVQSAATIGVADFVDPITGLLISLPDGAEPELNRLYLRLGSLPAAGRNEAVISDGFADAHGLLPGDRLEVVLNGRLQELVVSGIAVSPEHIYQLQPGELYPDNLRYGILWLNRSQLAPASDLDGAFNSVVLSLERDATPLEVVAELDRLLTPYGGIGAVTRADQQSHMYLEAEFEQLATMAWIYPAIFLAVAAFLLNVVLARLITTQREQIAILKAFGYTHWQVGRHYSQLVLLMTSLGLVLGTLGGLILGEAMARIYAEFFRFPVLEYRLSWQVILLGAAVTCGAALVGTLSAVRRAVLLPPAEAMRPEIPAAYRPTLIERLGWQRYLSQPSRMILRNFERRPGKALLAIFGISLACAILMMGHFWQDAADYMIDVQFGLAQRYDLAVSFNEVTSQRVLYELMALPGVTAAEGQRAVPVRLRHQHRTFRTVLHGLVAEGELRRVLDDRLAILSPPQDGLILTDYLAEMLALQIGDPVRVESLEGRRQVLDLPVVGLVNEHIGVSAYMEMAALNRALGEGEVFNGAFLAVAEEEVAAVSGELRESPRVAGVSRRMAAITNFRETMADTVLVFSFITTLLAGSIAFGIVYNSARIALSERSRELASLRVLGLTRAETDYILMGELALLTIFGIPVGWLIGYWFCWYLTLGLRSDLYRIPLVMEPATYATAATVVAIAAVISGLIVRRLLHRIDLVAALKSAD